ncbi:unnamed protein product [Rotaria sp. Silwood1]|nr:unnamed protein product [Rotaria sp. Silwood1]CAF1540465.1 unnamed protein product [Rotaria sp. Silwood1]
MVYVFFCSLRDRRKLDANKNIARLVIFRGLCLVGITAADPSTLSVAIKQSEQSSWPNSGKGIWIGLFVIVVGVFTLITVKEKSHSSFHVLLPYTWVAIILCLFGLFTSITVIQRYIKHPTLSDKTKRICWTVPNFCAKYQGPMPEVFNRGRPNSIIEIPLQASGTLLSPPRIIQSPRYRRRTSYIINRAYISS